MHFDVSNDLWRLHDLPLAEVVAHGGNGLVKTARLFDKQHPPASCRFIDYTVLPPETSIGEHTHALDNEEFYLILEGSGKMAVNGTEFPVSPGDLVRNPPGGTHRLANCGTTPMRLFVFEISAGVNNTNDAVCS